MFVKDVYLNACGRLNVKTGKNLHFNLEEWDGQGASLTLVEIRLGGYRVVGGWGTYEDGQPLCLHSGRTGTILDVGHVRATYPCSPEGREALAGALGTSRTVLFGTLD